VAISLAPEQKVYAQAPVEARIVSSSTFIALFNAFFLSLGALLPHTNIAWFALSLGLMGMGNSLNQRTALAHALAFLAQCVASNLVNGAQSLPLYRRTGVFHTTPIFTHQRLSCLPSSTHCAPQLRYCSGSSLGIARCSADWFVCLAKSSL
jgi:hypothetical protein